MRAVLVCLSFSLCVVVPGVVVPERLDAEDANAANPLTFEKHVLPVLKKRAAWTPEQRVARVAYEVIELKCFSCHGEKQQEAGLDLRTVDSRGRGSKSGPAVVAGDATGSLLFQRVQADEMPPREVRYKLSIKPVTQTELSIIKKWIDAGAVKQPELPKDLGEDDGHLVSKEDREWWSFRKPSRPALPDVRNHQRVRTPIDAFLLKRLEARGLTFSRDADRRTLVRRAYFYVTGMPPDPEDVDDVVNDPRPDAYDRLVERLLASPRYGEHWARYWLEAAGYTDSEGATSSDPINAEYYRYRDYVIRAFDADKPYDRFLLEQLAGDELQDYLSAPAMTPELADNLIATGFLRGGTDATTSFETNFLIDREKVISQRIEITGSAVLGLTLHCAQCHSHKYDPIPQRDYYRLGAIFAAAYTPREWLPPGERYIVLATAREQESAARHNAEIDRQLAPLRAELKRIAERFERQLLERKLAKIPEADRVAVGTALETDAAERTEEQKDLLKKYSATLKIEAKELDTFDAYKKESAATRDSIRDLESRRKTFARAFGLKDMRPDALPYHILRRGDALDRVREVRPDVPAVLKAADDDGQAPPLDIDRPWPDAPTTGRRLALAHWLVRSDHPLTARVIVNRIWQRYFGRGIVATVDNFGRTGVAPTHPALLDWLAVEFVHNGWSFKRLHRLILRSTAFRQDSRVHAESVGRDPNNELLWRMPMRRLDAEAIRDSILAATGDLDRKKYGPPGELSLADDGQVVTKDAAGNLRRSIYMLHRRSKRLTILETFDAPRISTNCTQRGTSIVVSQALLMNNSELMARMAARLAARVARETSDALDERIDRAYRLVLCRFPHDSERELASTFLQEQAEEYRRQQTAAGGSTENPIDPRAESFVDFCLTLLNAAEFLYVD